MGIDWQFHQVRNEKEEEKKREKNRKTRNLNEKWIVLFKKKQTGRLMDLIGWKIQMYQKKLKKLNGTIILEQDQKQLGR